MKAALVNILEGKVDAVTRFVFQLAPPTHPNKGDCYDSCWLCAEDMEVSAPHLTLVNTTMPGSKGHMICRRCSTKGLPFLRGSLLRRFKVNMSNVLRLTPYDGHAGDMEDCEEALDLLKEVAEPLEMILEGISAEESASAFIGTEKTGWEEA